MVYVSIWIWLCLWSTPKLEKKQNQTNMEWSISDTNSLTVVNKLSDQQDQTCHLQSMADQTYTNLPLWSSTKSVWQEKLNKCFQEKKKQYD